VNGGSDASFVLPETMNVCGEEIQYLFQKLPSAKPMACVWQLGSGPFPANFLVNSSENHVDML
jgi:hypothetical protein